MREQHRRGPALVTAGADGASGLVLAYDQRLVVEDLSLAIPRAGSVIVEPNACGKSTLLRALARLL
ncbi:MAG: hypothetical protein M3P97_04395, partial [Actinomycetota bacterium]|nr:hypothetical protein [Actinomycetota bacterium]